jgi:energy-coupling factor transport system permease protein
MPLPRDLHPVAWWCWAIGLAAAASFTTNPYLLLLVVGVAGLVVAARRSDHLWSRSFRFYVWLGAATVVFRILWRVLLGGYPGEVVLGLPEVPLPDFVLGVTILGPVTREALLSGLYDGLRLGAVVVCVGAANALANPKRLLRSLPPALYEVGTAMVVAVTVLPQLTESARRVRAAQTLRAGESGRVRGLRRTLVPVLEDTLERSLALAAGMDTRGYGRSGAATPAERRTTGALMLAGLVGVCVGVYAVLDQTAPRVLAAPMLVAGVAVASTGFVLAGRRVSRTRYRAERWRPAEVVVALSGLVVAGTAWWVSSYQVAIAYPDLDRWPELTVVALLGVLVGLVPAVAAPLPASALRAEAPEVAA